MQPEDIVVPKTEYLPHTVKNVYFKEDVFDNPKTMIPDIDYEEAYRR